MGRALRLANVRVMVLAGGKGTRLLPYTAVIPKPLVPLGDLPILDILLRQLHGFGFRQIMLSVGHQAPLIEAYCGDGRRWNLDIAYLRETRPMGTVGALSTLAWTADPVLVINGDILTDFDLRRLVRTHQRARNVLTLGVCARELCVDFGVVERAARGRLVGYREKPRLHYWVSAGMAVCSPAAARLLRPNRPCNLPDLVARALARRARVGSVPVIGTWLDIGRPDDYSRAQQLFEAHPRQFVRRRAG